MIGAYDAAVRIYDVATWRVVDTLRAPFQWERTGAFTGDGVVVGSFGAKPIDHRLGLPERPPLTFGVNALASCGERIFAGRDDGAVVDVHSRRVVANHCSIVNSVAVSPGGSTLASADYGSTICITELADGRSWHHAVEGGPVNSLAWHPDGQLLYSASYDGCVRAWRVDGPDLVPVATFRAAHGPIKSIAWSGAADLLVAGSSDGSVSGWRDEGEVWRARRDDMVLVNAVSCADGAGIAVSVSRDRAVRLWDAADGGLVEALPTVHQKSVKAVAVNPDASLIVTGSYDGTAVAGRRVNGGWSFAVLDVHGKPGVPAVMLANRGIVTAGWSGTVAEWSEGGRLRTVHDPGPVSGDAVATPDERQHVAAGGA
jgi:WD40 repeat protein